MASLGTFVNRFVGVRDLAEAPSAIWTRTESPRLRPLANEDIYLFVKTIDNGNVVRVVDPVERRERSTTMATGFVAAMLIIAGLVPTASNIMAGFRLQQLHAEQTKLLEEGARIDAYGARLTSPERLRALAKKLKMIEPRPEQVQTLEGPHAAEHAAVARNAPPFASNGATAR